MNTRIKGLVEAVQDAGRLLRDFDDAVARLANDSQDKVHDTTYPNHLRDFAPIFKINPQKELEIIANKYRLQAQRMTELAMTKVQKLAGYPSRSKSLSQSTGKHLVTSVHKRGETQAQNILGESGIINEQLAPTLTSVARGGKTERNESLGFFNRIPGANLQSTQRQKIKVARWLSSLIGEYDVTNEFWTV